MVGHSGTSLIDGDPVVCGGGDDAAAITYVECFQYERGTKNWKRVNLLENFDTDTENI